MDLTTIIGIILGLTTLIGGYLLEGGDLQGIFFPTAVLIVFGGTIAVTVASFTRSQLKTIGGGLRKALFVRSSEQSEIVEDLLHMATIARREGILRLETRAEQYPNPLMREGLLLIIDGADAETTRTVLTLEIEKVYREGEQQAKIFDTAGGFAPTLGIIGTVLGLINLLGSLQEPALLAKSISIAFTATLYGVASANLIYLPIANKIKARTQEQTEDMELIMEGLLSLQAGDHPNLMRRKLSSYLRSSSQTERDTSDEAGEDA